MSKEETTSTFSDSDSPPNLDTNGNKAIIQQDIHSKVSQSCVTDSSDSSDGNEVPPPAAKKTKKVVIDSSDDSSDDETSALVVGKQKPSFAKDSSSLSFVNTRFTQTFQDRYFRSGGRGGEKNLRWYVPIFPIF